MQFESQNELSSAYLKVVERALLLELESIYSLLRNAYIGLM